MSGRLLLSSAVILILVFAAWSCRAREAQLTELPGPGSGDLPPGAVKPGKQADCPSLESRLYQIVSAEDPVSLVEKLGIALTDGQVRVVIELAGEDESAIEQFDVEIETRIEKRLQALVPYEQLCELSKASGVLAVRLPKRAVLP